MACSCAGKECAASQYCLGGGDYGVCHAFQPASLADAVVVSILLSFLQASQLGCMTVSRLRELPLVPRV
jgi:hypothetical protein